jgi:hypothetical protein
MLKDIAPTMEYALFPKTIPNQRQSYGKRVTINAITVQVSKQKEVTPGQLWQTIAEWWENLTNITGGSLYVKSFIPFRKECGLDDNTMHHLIEQQEVFLNTTKQWIVDNLNDIAELMDVELTHNKNDDTDGTEMTIREQFMAQLDAKGNSSFAGMENTKVPGSYCILIHEQKAVTVFIFSLDLDDKLRDFGNCEESDAPNRYNTFDKISIVGSQIVPPKTASFCINHSFSQISHAAIPT